MSNNFSNTDLYIKKTEVYPVFKPSAIESPVILSDAYFGYSTSARGEIEQLTSRTTTVHIDKPCGSIKLFSAAGSTSPTTFRVLCGVVFPTSTIIINQASGTDQYIISVTNIDYSSFYVTFFTTGGTTIEQPVFNYSVIKCENI